MIVHNNNKEKKSKRKNHFYCQIGFHIQGIFSGVFGADLNIENIGKIGKKYD